MKAGLCSYCSNITGGNKVIMRKTSQHIFLENRKQLIYLINLQTKPDFLSLCPPRLVIPLRILLSFGTFTF